MNAHIGRFLTVLKRWEMLRAIMQFYRIRVNSAEYFVVGVIIVVTARQRQLHLLKTFFPPQRSFASATWFATTQPLYNNN